jgi:hypothetical protein
VAVGKPERMRLGRERPSGRGQAGADSAGPGVAEWPWVSGGGATPAIHLVWDEGGADFSATLPSGRSAAECTCFVYVVNF